eukprot:1159630-Pelagomonas_calceolata.AAC.4
MELHTLAHNTSAGFLLMCQAYLLNMTNRAWFDLEGSVTSCWYHTWLPMPGGEWEQRCFKTRAKKERNNDLGSGTPFYLREQKCFRTRAKKRKE